MAQPNLETERLILRPFSLSDTKQVQELAGDITIAEMTLLIPHPYEDGMAEEFISSLEAEFQKGLGVTYAITTRSSNSEESILIGTISLGVDVGHDCAEIGYWIGKPFWGNGYCPEAAKRIIDYGFKELKLNCISGRAFEDNERSKIVFKKLGMSYEGLHRARKKRFGIYKDLCYYSILRSEYEERKN